jgi:lipopolysaccharide/colanic/teichoic acid biosynthesis glycosyltransferase
MSSYYTAKRAMDVLLSSLLLLALLPLLALIWLAIRLTSPGPALFLQRRMGRHGRPFTIHKFRTMADGSARELDLVTRGDPRVTPVGRLLRRAHLDELPQLWDVLRGRMSMVGPRPDEYGIAEHLSRTVPGYAGRLDMPPGITGLSQLAGRERVNALGRGYEVLLHRLYRRRRSLAYDLRLVAMTVPHVLRKGGV